MKFTHEKIPETYILATVQNRNNIIMIITEIGMGRMG